MYSVGHKGRYGHEFLEFEFRGDGKMRYANNSHYKNEVTELGSCNKNLELSLIWDDQGAKE